MRIAILSLTDPDGPGTGATLRVRAFADNLEALGHEVFRVFPPTRATGEAPAPAGVGESLGERSMPGWLRGLKRELLPMPTSLGARNADLNDAVKALLPLDILVITALSQVGYARLAPGAARWMDFMDLWSNFGPAEVRRRRGLARVTTRLQIAHLRRLETRVASRADVVTVAGWQDVEALRARGCRAHWQPTTLPDQVFATTLSGPRPRVAGMFADFRYWPNVDAYETLVNVWAPRLHAAGWGCVVAGIGSDDLPAHPLVERIGRVAEVADFYNLVGATVAPLSLGGGMKVKVVESLGHGIPVLASDSAVEGLPRSVADLVMTTDLEDPDIRLLERLLDPVITRDALRPYMSSSLHENLFRLTRSFREQKSS